MRCNLPQTPSKFQHNHDLAQAVALNNLRVGLFRVHAQVFDRLSNHALVQLPLFRQRMQGGDDG